MYQDYYQYLQWLKMCLHTQEKRIESLEQTIQKMSAELKQMKEKPAIHVDRVEYKFDQLKVETLEGTLNIGLNPAELSGIEDFTVQNQSLNTPFSPKAQMQRTLKIEEAIYRYLETDLSPLIEETQRKLNIQPNESYLSFIKQDVIKQLPGRIEHYLKVEANKERSGEQTISRDDEIIELLKQEIQNGVYIFLNNLPENVKGMKTE